MFKFKVTNFPLIFEDVSPSDTNSNKSKIILPNMLSFHTINCPSIFSGLNFIFIFYFIGFMPIICHLIINSRILQTSHCHLSLFPLHFNHPYLDLVH